MKTFLLLIIAIVMSALSAGASFAFDDFGQAPRINYSWASKRMNTALWGISKGDINGDGSQEYLLLERHAVQIGNFEGDSFKQTAKCDLGSLAAGTKVYAVDIDNDGTDEIAVSAVAEGMPASAVFKVKDGACLRVVNQSRYSLRAMPSSPGNPVRLYGQGWSSQAFFLGPVVELKLENEKLKDAAKIDIPRYVTLYQFAAMPDVDGIPNVAAVKGNAPLEVMEKGKGRFKRTWRTPDRMGGTINLVDAPQRPALDELSSELASFDVPPIIIVENGQPTIIALRLDMPLHGIIGKRPQVRGSRVELFKPDSVLGFVEKARTIDLPGAVVDMILDSSSGGKKLMVLMQNDVSMFHEGMNTVIMSFDLLQ